MKWRSEWDFHPAALAVRDRPPALSARLILLSITVFMILVLLWMAWSEIDVAVTAQGKIVPAGKVKQIQVPEGGVIKQILVSDGQHVVKDEVLVVLDQMANQAEMMAVSREVEESRLEAARLEAQIRLDATPEFLMVAEGLQDEIELQTRLLQGALDEQHETLAELDSQVTQAKAQIEVIRSTLEKLTATVPLLQQRLDNLRSLGETGYVSKLDITDARLNLLEQQQEKKVQQHRLGEAEAALLAAEAAVLQAKAKFHQETLEALAEARSRLHTAQSELEQLQDQLRWKQIASPVNGTVQQVSINTEGGVLTAAQIVMVIVPDDLSLEVEAKIANRDIGSLRVGQKVQVKLEPFNYTRYGFLEGRLDWLAKDSIIDEELGLVYPCRVRLSSIHLPNRVRGKRGSAKLGMSATVDILIGKRSPLDFFIAPILRYRDESLRES